MIRTALLALFSVLILGTQAQTVDTFNRPSDWQPAKDSGNPPTLTPAAGGLRAVYTEAKPGWGNIHRDLKLNGSETGVRVDVRVVSAQPKAAMHV